jgi:hypothetical protein
MSQVSTVVQDDDIDVGGVPELSAQEREQQNAEARRRIEQMREDAALKRALNDDIFDY